MSNFLGIIPARYHSSRFPGKPLARIGNKPMIQWVYERASGSLERLVVATDDDRIRKAVEQFGGEAVMTSAEHGSGTERCAEALEIMIRKQKEQFTHVVNIQGDEPLLDREHVPLLREAFGDPSVEIATLMHPLGESGDVNSPNVVKVVTDRRGRALYFSRSPIPHIRNKAGKPAQDPPAHFGHMGIYAYRTDVLRKIVSLPPSPLEQAESLEQLRWLENGFTIRAIETRHAATGVDTPEDLERVRRSL